jgi:hypothetical protein
MSAPTAASTATTPWAERLARDVRAFVSRVLRPPRRRPAPLRRRTLPCDLYLTLGWQSIPLFQRGPIDEFCFFQRLGVSAAHDTEFLARLDPEDAGSEDYKPYGVFSLRPGEGEPVPGLALLEGLWARLLAEHGLSSVPSAQAMASRRFGGFDPRYARFEDGINRIDPPRSGKAFAEVDGRRFSYADMLELLRRELSGLQKIAWIEDAFREAPGPGEIVHRYYVEAETKQAVLVRHHWDRGKRLYRARTNAEALQLCLASGHFGRGALAA